MPTWLESADHDAWLRRERLRLLDFGRAARLPSVGFGWLDEDGRVDPDRPSPLWVVCRMTHVHALGALTGVPGCLPLAAHGVDALGAAFRDEQYGGWFSEVGPDGPTSTTKTAYEHAFVVLAATSGVAAHVPGADELLAVALATFLDRFWDDGAGMVVEEWNRDFTVLDPYRGVNAAMHAVEAMLAAADVTGDLAWRERALRVTTRVVHELAADHDWRIPEHFDESWRPLLDYHVDEPAHPFRPYGATIGHWLEWSRLTAQLAAGLGDAAPGWMLADARSLFDAAVREGWAVDGAAGFVYTVDWHGQPVVRERMHWVVAEATAAAATLHAATGEEQYAAWYATWWDYIAEHLLDPERGSWRHELSAANEPSSLTWVGKPDLYHALQATLIPRRPLATSVVAGLLA